MALHRSYCKAQAGVRAEKERTLIMKTTLKFPQGPYQICARVFKTGEWNKQLTMPRDFRIAKFALESRWHQVPCVFYFFCYYASSITRAALRLFKGSL